MEYKKVKREINNFTSDNIRILEELFPSAVKDGLVDFQALKEELGHFDEVDREKYELTWTGKQNAKKIAQQDIYNRTLKYVHDESKNPNTTENLYIEGDNLEVLKLLRQNYYGAIKMIYIDPPYNTGNDFIYHDNFVVSKKESDIAEGTRDQVGNTLQKNQNSSNRYHANWLNMMYPRLKVAKDLLKDDGVIFISIDDNEVDNLIKCCDEIFGHNNKIGLMTIQSNPRGSQSSKHLSNVHEYILMYAKNSNVLELKGVTKSENNLKEYCETDENGRKYRLLGLRQRGGAWKKEDRPLMHYPIYINPLNGSTSLLQNEEFSIEVIPQRPTGELSRWTWGKDKFELENDFIIGKRINRTGVEEAWDIFRKDYIDNIDGSEKTAKIKTIWIEKETNYQNAKNEIKELFSNSEIFDFPKPVYIVKQLFSMLNHDEGDIALDFFSGSATTAHAVMKLNAEDGGKRRFIMVQLPELCSEKSETYRFLTEHNKPTNICEIGKERIRRAGDIIKKEIEISNSVLEIDEKVKQVPDIGFKVFCTTDTNLKWNVYDEFLHIDDSIMINTPDIADFIDGFTDVNVVYEIMLRQKNIPLSASLETLADVGNRTFIFGNVFLICLETEITVELIEKLASLNPLPMKYVFRDSAFKDDINLKDETFRRLKNLIERNCGLNKTTYTVEFI